ncbi:WhiB family transcriptional regulator [Streptomyces sp. NPDC087901]|uniref:WhiB family transcriptional regulator n=1 Tax=Streptomyces sp. NPDC087901 TaxID=3365818 RepID=UPI003819E2F1
MKSVQTSNARDRVSTRTAPGESTEPLCVGSDPSKFFPDGLGPALDSQVAAAKQVCSVCPFRLNCLANAIRFNAEEGIWAGFTPRERRRLSSRAKSLARFDRHLIERVAAGHIVDVDRQDRSTVVMGLHRQGWDIPRIARAMELTPIAVQLNLQTELELEFFLHAHERSKLMTAECPI